MKKLKNSSVLLLITAMLLPAWSVAQDEEGTQWVTVRTVTTHAGQATTWAEQQVKLAAARTARGDPERHIWQEVTGDLDTFHIVSYSDSLGGEGGPNQDPPMGDAQDDWGEKIQATVASRSSVIMRRLPALTIPPAEGAEPAILLLRRTTVAPGRSSDYNDWLSDSLVPALRKAGATGVTFNRVVYGGDINLWVSATRIPNVAALNGPGPLASLGEEEMAAVFEGLDDVIWLSERILLRYREDLSNSGPSED